MSYDLKIFAIKLASTLISAPFFGWGIMLYAEMGNGGNVVQDFDQIEKSANESQDPRASGRNCYMGACEMFVGALVWLIPFPGTSVLASIMIGDGVRRVADGLVQLSDERREDPNFVEPKPPF